MSRPTVFSTQQLNLTNLSLKDYSVIPTFNANQLYNLPIDPNLPIVAATGSILAYDGSTQWTATGSINQLTIEEEAGFQIADLEGILYAEGGVVGATGFIGSAHGLTGGTGVNYSFTSPTGVISIGQPVSYASSPTFAALAISGSGFAIRTEATPASSGAPGVTGDIRWSTDGGTGFLYICVSTDYWTRTALSPWI